MIRRLIRRCTTDRLLRDSSFLMASTVLTGIFNTGYQMVMGRALSAEEFAVLATLLGALRMLTPPLNTIGLAITHFTAHLSQAGRKGDIKRLTIRWVLRMLALGVPVVAAIYLLRVDIAEFLHLSYADSSRTPPILLLGLCIAVLLLRPITMGCLHGLQLFQWVMLATLAGTTFKFFSGAALVHGIKPAAGWGLLGHGLGIGIMILLSSYIFGKAIRGERPTSEPLPSIHDYTARAFFIFLGYAIFMNADMILVRHYLPDQAGPYAYASTIGKLNVFLTTPLAQALFPKVVSSGETRKSDRKLLQTSVLYSLAVLLPAVVVCCIVPWLPLLVLFGVKDPSPDLVHMVQIVPVIMAFVALINVTIHFHVAQRRFLQVLVVPVMSLVYLAGVVVWHDSVWQIIGILAGTTAVCLVAGTALTDRGGREGSRNSSAGDSV